MRMKWFYLDLAAFLVVSTFYDPNPSAPQALGPC